MYHPFSSEKGKIKEEILRNRLLKDKTFLYEVYTKPTKKIIELIESASKYKINTILHYLHKVCSGQVRMSRKDFEKIVAQKRLFRLRKGIEKRAALRLSIKDKEHGVNFLVSIASSLPILLVPLFEKENE